MFIRALAFLWLVTQLGLGQQPTPILPDPNLTPGDTFDVTAQDACTPGCDSDLTAGTRLSLSGSKANGRVEEMPLRGFGEILSKA